MCDLFCWFKKDVSNYLPKKFIYYHFEAIHKTLVDERFFDYDYISNILPKAQLVLNYGQLGNQWFIDGGI